MTTVRQAPSCHRCGRAAKNIFRLFAGLTCLERLAAAPAGTELTPSASARSRKQRIAPEGRPRTSCQKNPAMTAKRSSRSAPSPAANWSESAPSFSASPAPRQWSGKTWPPEPRSERPERAATRRNKGDKANALLNLPLPNGHRLLVGADRLREVTEHENGGAQLRLKDTTLPVLETPEAVTTLLKAASRNPSG